MAAYEELKLEVGCQRIHQTSSQFRIFFPLTLFHPDCIRFDAEQERYLTAMRRSLFIRANRTKLSRTFSNFAPLR